MNNGAVLWPQISCHPQDRRGLFSQRNLPKNQIATARAGLRSTASQAVGAGLESDRLPKSIG